MWAGETFSSLLNRFNKIISGISDFEFELENESLANTLIHNQHNVEGKFRVKKSNLKIQFDFGKIYPLTKTKIEKDNQLVEFG
ncbi:hypothetical protein JIY74_31020 [Vibrio harveyi]|nr:hypothetical protein [Vibrio harveyi]